MRISDWSSDVCSSDLAERVGEPAGQIEEDAELQQVEGEVEQRLDADKARGRRIERRKPDELGRASCKDRVCQYVYISVVAVSIKKHIKTLLFFYHFLLPSNLISNI